jgi:hypothetical protein
MFMWLKSFISIHFYDSMASGKRNHVIGNCHDKALSACLQCEYFEHTEILHLI